MFHHCGRPTPKWQRVCIYSYMHVRLDNVHTAASDRNCISLEHVKLMENNMQLAIKKHLGQLQPTFLSGFYPFGSATRTRAFVCVGRPVAAPDTNGRISQIANKT